MQAVALFGLLLLTLVVFRLPVLPSLQLLYEGALGDKFAVGRTLEKATPLLFTGLGMVVAWRAGAYNIGGEGQFVIGGLSGAWVAKIALGHVQPSGFLIAIILLFSCIGGGLWAGIAGWLQVKRGVEAVISTILLNFVALQALDWAIRGPLQQKARELPQTENLPDAMMLWRPDRQTDLHAGVILALLAAVGIFIYLFRTVGGYRLRLVGSSPGVARASRIPSDAVTVKAFLLSGALCGLAAGVEYTGAAGLIGNGFSQNWGFLGIPVALISGLHPLGAILGALYFGALLAGSENLGRFTESGPTIVYVVQSAAVLGFIAIGAIKRNAPAPMEAEA